MNMTGHGVCPRIEVADVSWDMVDGYSWNRTSFSADYGILSEPVGFLTRKHNKKSRIKMIGASIIEIEPMKHF